MPILAAELIRTSYRSLDLFSIHSWLCFDQPSVFPYLRLFRACWTEKGNLIWNPSSRDPSLSRTASGRTMTDSSCESRGRPDSQCENSDRSDAPDNAAASSIRGGKNLPPGSDDRSSALLIVGLPSDLAQIPNSLEATRTI